MGKFNKLKTAVLGLSYDKNRWMIVQFTRAGGNVTHRLGKIASTVSTTSKLKAFIPW